MRDFVAVSLRIRERVWGLGLGLGIKFNPILFSSLESASEWGLE